MARLAATGYVKRIYTVGPSAHPLDESLVLLRGRGTTKCRRKEPTVRSVPRKWPSPHGPMKGKESSMIT